MAAYSFGSTGKVQTFTIGQAGTYDIAAFGAQGGGVNTVAGGKGAETGGYFNLTAGEKLKVVVGTTPSYSGGEGNGNAANGGGGGGGSFVLASTNGGTSYSLLLVAGGGGGTGYFGRTASSAGGGATSANSAPGNGSGGTGGGGFGGGGGGAGYKGAGGTGNQPSPGTGAPSYTSAGTGGRYASNGGFGGGGGGNDGGGGGGGGYTGGSGGGSNSPGKGGTSIDKGTPIAAQTLAAVQTGNGQVTVTLAQAAPAITSEAASPTGADLDAGKVVTFTLQTNESVTATGSSLALSNGATAAYASGNGTANSPLTYSYTVASGDTNTADLQATALNGTVQNGFGFALDDTTFKPIDAMDQIDTVPPTITALAESGAGIDANGNGDLNTGKTVTLTVTTSEPVYVTGGTPTLTLNDGGTATYTGGSGTAQQTFSYTVAAGQNVANLAVNQVNANGATVTDQAGNPVNPASIGSATKPSGTLTIDTTPPAASSVTDTAAQGSGPTPIGLAAPSDNLTPAGSLAIAVTGLPNDGTVTLSDGTTAVQNGMALTAAQLTGLLFTPTGTAGQGSAFTYSVTDGAGNASQGTATLNVGAAPVPTPIPVAPGSGSAVGVTPADAVSFTPQVTFVDGVFTLFGTATSAVGVSNVELFATLDDGSRADLGAAAVNANGTFVFTDDVGFASGTQGFITAVETDGAGVSTSAQASYALTAGLDTPDGSRAPFVAEQDVYNADGSAETSVSLFRNDGTVPPKAPQDSSRQTTIMAPGQTFVSDQFDDYKNDGQPDTTFVFNPNHGLDTISLFRVDGADHDSLSFKGSDFGNSVANVLADTIPTSGGSSIIVDPMTGDAVRLTGISLAKLTQNQGDITFHA